MCVGASARTCARMRVLHAIISHISFGAHFNHPPPQNRELQIMRILSRATPHPCIVSLKHFFFSGTGTGTGTGNSSNENASANIRAANTEQPASANTVADGASASDADADACSNRKQMDSTYLNLVLEYMPETVYSLIRHHTR